MLCRRARRRLPLNDFELGANLVAQFFKPQLRAMSAKRRLIGVRCCASDHEPNMPETAPKATLLP
jgi:hypothetical protein